MSEPASTEEWEEFAPKVGSKAARFWKELCRKTRWIRTLKGLPPWRTKEEVLEADHER